MIGNSKSSQRELARIQWRQQILSTPTGVAWLTDQAANRKTREKDLGPHRFVPGVSDEGGLT